MITAEWVYWLVGTFFLATGVQVAFDGTHDKRLTTSAFWSLLGLSLYYSSFVSTLPVWPLGLSVITMALIAGLGLTSRGTVATTNDEEREASARRRGDALFAPALTIPIVTVTIAVGVAKLQVHGAPLIAKGQETLVGLGVAAVCALVVGFVLLRPKQPAVAFNEGRRLLESVGWAVLLPQMLSVLGGLFAQAGVGADVGIIAQHIVPEQSRILAVIVYAVGMALFTVVMGNAFAAFPIMTAAIGWPVLVERFGAHPGPLFAIGMLAGYCGTLCTPMAANFNLVPPALLEMTDKYRQIKVQIPTAIALFVVNAILLVVLPFT